MTVFISSRLSGFTLRPSVACSTDCMDDGFDALLDKANYMKSERNRLKTYGNWPSNACQSPHSLAKAGFYYTGTDDRVECPFCFGILKKWKPTDIPMSEHRTHFPYCKFVKGEHVGNTPIEEVERSSIPSLYTTHVENVEALGALNLLDLTTEENRLRSFSRWPTHLTQTPDVLARAGFYHIPSDEKPDRVKCAYCRGKLYNWEWEDDPWLQHARCFPTCPYMKLCVGENVIGDLQNKECVGANEGTNPSPTTYQPETRNNATSLMKSEAVQAVLEMGFPSGLVKEAIEVHDKTKDSQSLSAEDLASIVLEMEQNDKENRSPNHHRSTLSQTTSHTTHHENSRETLTPSNTENVHFKTQDRTLPSSQTSGMSKNLDLKTSLREENSRLKAQYLCRVCMENEVRVTFMPCGHLACCGPCSMAMSECPVCRTAITGCVRTYF